MHPSSHRIATVVITIASTAAAGAFGGFVFELTGFARRETAILLYCASGLTSGVLVARFLGTWWVKSLEESPLYQALLLGIVVQVPCGLLTVAISTVILAQTQGFWSAVMSAIMALGVGIAFAIGGGLLSGGAYYLLTTGRPG